MMKTFYKSTPCFAFFVLLLFYASASYSQCVGLPAVSALGSNKIPAGLCAPVNAELIYNIQFASPVQGGLLELVYDWGDSSPIEVVTLNAGTKTFSEKRTHDFPEESGCEYIVTMHIRYNGVVCSNTRQMQRISSWRTDQYNGGKIALKSPVTGTNEHLVCEGSDLSVVFRDNSVFNCNAQYIQRPPDAIESPNVGDRWQQIVYNTSITGTKIPNVSVDGVAITSSTGSSIVSSYADPRGVFHMADPVVIDDVRRRPSLEITAPGGFGAGFPKAGDIFTITLRYWNFCNPYDDPNIPGPPADLVNGDHSPIEATSTIRVVAPPSAPVATDETVCYGITPKDFGVTGISGSNSVRWYENIPNPDRPGKLIATAKNLPLTSHPLWVSNATPGIYKVWASQQPTTGIVSCESPKTLVIRTIREKIEVQVPSKALSSEVCNTSSASIAFPSPSVHPVGGATQYTWTGSDGVKVSATSPSTADVTISITDFKGKLSADREITVGQSYASGPSCVVSKRFPVRVYKTPVGGTLSAVSPVCEGNAVPNLKLSGYSGTIKRWEIKRDDGVFITLKESPEGEVINPGILEPGSYVFRAVVSNGTCADSYSSESPVKVLSAPAIANAGQDQFHCSSLVSAPFGANSAGTNNGQWSYVSSVPKGLPMPVFSNINDPNATITILPENAGAYTFRWTISNSICLSTDEVVIDFGTTPSDAVAGADQMVCGSDATLEALVPQKGIGVWTVVTGPGNCQGVACEITIENPASPTSKVMLTNTKAYGSYTLRWSVSSGGNSCFLKSDDVNIRFDRPVDLKAEDTDVICIDSEKLSAIDLVGNVEGESAAAYWEKMDGSGIVSSSTFANGTVKASYSPTRDDYAAGSPIRVKLVAVPQSNSVCAVTERVINIKIDRKPVAVAGDDLPFICSSEVILHADPPLHGAKGEWSASDPSVVFSDKADPNTVVKNLPSAPADLSVNWTVTSQSGNCVSNPSTIQLKRVSLPDVRDVEVIECEVSEGTTQINLSSYENSLTNLSNEQREITWYRAQDGQSTLVSERILSDIADGDQFTAQVKDLQTGCSDRADLMVKVAPTPETENGLVSLCEETPGSKTVNGINLFDVKFTEAVTKEKDVTLTWHSSDSEARSKINAIATSVRVAQGKEFFARVTRNTAPFCFAVTKVAMVVNPTPAISEILGRESVCQGDPQTAASDLPVESYQVTPIPGAKYHWEVPQGENEYRVFGGGAKGDFYLLLQFPNVVTGKIKVRPELNGCSGPVVEKDVQVASAPVRPIIAGDTVVNQNTKAVAFRVNPNNYPSSTYNWEIRRSSDNSFGGAYIIEGQSTGNVLVNILSENITLSVRENNAMCASATAIKNISVVEPEKPVTLKALFYATPTASCFPATVTVRNVSTGADTYIWTLANENGVVATSNLTNPEFKVSGPGTYSLRLTATHSLTGQSDDMELPNIRILDVPYAAFNANTDLVYAPDTELKLLNFSSRAVSYLWSFGDGNTSTLFEPIHTYQNEGKYEVTLLAGIDHGQQDFNGDGIVDGPMVCYDTAKMIVTARNGGYIKIPNAFSPNEGGPTGGRGMSGFNDVFLPIMQGVKTYRMQIFDRWGTKVFETNDPDIGWDGYDKSGALMSAGVYVYKIEVTLSNGSRDTRMGDVGLIR